MATQDSEAVTQDKVQAVTEPKTEEGEAKTEKTYTQQEVSKIQSTFEKKAREAEREAKLYKQQLEQTTSSVSVMQEQLSRLTADMEQRELAGIMDLPEGRKIAELSKQLRHKEADLVKQQTEFSKTQAQAFEGLKMKDAIALAKEYEIDVDDLMECGSYQDMLDKTLKIIKSQKGTIEPKKKEPLVSGHPDSGLSSSSGKGKIYTASEIENMGSDKRFELRKEISKAYKEGRIDPTK